LFLLSALYEAIATARRNGNYEITLTESECDLCMELAYACLEHQLAVWEALQVLPQGERYRVLQPRWTMEESVDFSHLQRTKQRS